MATLGTRPGTNPWSRQASSEQAWPGQGYSQWPKDQGPLPFDEKDARVRLRGGAGEASCKEKYPVSDASPILAVTTEFSLMGGGELM